MTDSKKQTFLEYFYYIVFKLVDFKIQNMFNETVIVNVVNVKQLIR